MCVYVCIGAFYTRDANLLAQSVCVRRKPRRKNPTQTNLQIQLNVLLATITMHTPAALITSPKMKISHFPSLNTSLIPVILLA